MKVQQFHIMPLGTNQFSQKDIVFRAQNPDIPSVLQPRRVIDTVPL